VLRNISCCTPAGDALAIAMPLTVEAAVIYFGIMLDVPATTAYSWLCLYVLYVLHSCR
jgi:hypothetical protein